MKRLFLGSAAVIIATAGARPPDLPVKPKPVEYVKVCSLYGAGFWYVPGTDTCLKIGAFARLDVNYNADGSGAPMGGAQGTASPAIMGGAFTRADSNFNFRERTAISVDMRTQT